MRRRLKALCCSTLFRRLASCAALILICSSAPAQNLFVSAAELNSSGFAVGGKIDEITPEGVQSTFASGLDALGRLAFDSAGNLFVGDFNDGSPGSGSILKFTPDGIRSTFALGLNGPYGLAFDKAGNLFVADYGGNILKFSPDGIRSTFALGLNRPYGLSFDQAGNLFVADGSAIYKYTPEGVRSTFASGLFDPLALAFDSRGNLFVADGGYDGYDWPPVLGAALYKFTPSGLRSTVAWEGDYVWKNGVGRFVWGPNPVIPGSLAIDSTDNLFVADSLSGNVLKFTPSGVRSVFASGLLGSLAVQPTHPAAPTLVNISARGSVQMGDNALIGGFIVTGSNPQPVIARGLGPSLSRFGVSDALQDPVLELHHGTSILNLNDDWQTAAASAQVPMNYRPADARESAFMTTLTRGAYITVLSGKNGATGNGLLEVYSTTSGLSNVSTRGFVGTGDDVLIGGFSSRGGNGSLQVIIRALGPTLTQFGINAALADPTLTLVNSNGSVIASNDNWKNTQQNVIQASGFAPPNDLESAIFATLTNGNYTAIVAGKNDGTGVGLLEVYKVAVAVNQ
jgi:sugar lactone lactonase YvrE